jgi:hypothetical protein
MLQSLIFFSVVVVVVVVVVEVHVRYLAFSGDDGQHEFHSDKGSPGHSCTSLLRRMGVL